MVKVKVRLQPIVSELIMPTVLKTTILPGESIERLFIATHVGEIFCKLNDFSIIETDYNFGSPSAYYVSLGTNLIKPDCI